MSNYETEGEEDQQEEEEEKSDEDDHELVADSDSDQDKIAIEGFEDDVKYDRIAELKDFVRVRKSSKQELEKLGADELKQQKKDF